MRPPVLIGALLLAACAAPYRPQAGEDAAKMRVRMADGAGISTLWTHMRPVSDGRQAFERQPIPSGDNACG